MSKGGGTGSKREGAHTNKGMGKCTGSHAKQCGSGIDLDVEHYEYRHKKHNFDESLHQNPLKPKKSK